MRTRITRIMSPERPMRSERLRRLAVRVALALLPGATLGAQGGAPVARDTAAHGAHDMAWTRETFVLSEMLEHDAAASERPVLFDIVGWTGGARRRLWFKIDGAAPTVGGGAHGEVQLLYGQMISPWWDAQIGVRSDLARVGRRTVTRTGAVLGVQGLAPGWFEVEPSLFVTSRGRVSLNLTASYDLFVTQRLVLQPRLESSAALQDDTEFGVGRGLSESAFGLRARYEIRREFAPYAGIVWERAYGRSARLVRSGGGEVGETRLVMGLRLWY
ncbi:copper resistance protein B [Gemmatimonas sp. UBA7669]|uniref:copper resistance protein B n=1 Tax=Gemmatimonas sp. UBA7669 TaxID=1946568 RepID=UPI0025BC1390|nr:copper resistance protein B [Gemmatimonas sp. UBA7669]